ncbi:PhnD/SsuA/transferrin family substrate-binding protein [Methylobacter sp.]|uniref:phosphate/phosphite/phosphonate ABC transporter substrate-binding protein n=1 Tax=Methylobacter sp. TaxID=2051955 RepID=UPI00120FFB5E|nr:PhnD/SsuA/transferrin family substrate-binding protein [Methylobacter sp.]TAK60677.1 MAG: phosphate/phosphite/phosphonate ABC transporter substrate-binding protein [Methylobacter sp.]
MIEILRRYSLITLLLIFNCAVLADTPSLETPANKTKPAQVSKNDSESEETVFMKWWKLLLDLPLLSGSNKQSNDAYEPSFSAQSKSKATKYVIGIHPLHNPKRLFEVYGPIVDFINANISEADFTLEASRNYEEFDKRLYSGYFDFAMPNPYQTINSLKHGYRVFGKMSDDNDFRGIILVRRDSGINTIADLKGKTVSYPAPTALAATMMPQYYLHTHGIDINLDIENRYVGSQESSIINVLRGHVAAGATWPVPWKTFSKENPQLAEQLEVKWQTEPLQNNGWVVRKDIPTALADKFATLLFNLDQHAQGREMLARIPVTRFEPANDDSYGPVQAFIATFIKTVRPLE